MIAETAEIISSLIAAKNEVVQIAHVLEAKLVAQRVSETEIDCVTTNLVPLIPSDREGSLGSTRSGPVSYTHLTLPTKRIV